jgi:pimeloyl-ACP methyl ester carboxylesterase
MILHRRQTSPATPENAACRLVVVVALCSLLGCSGISVHQRKTLDQLPEGLASAVTPPPREALALVQTAITHEPSDPTTSIVVFREAALRALPFVLMEGVSTHVEPAAEPGAQATYRRAIEYAVLAAQRQAQAEGISWTEALARGGIAVRGVVGPGGPEQWHEAVPVRCFEVEGFHKSVARGGLGAPLVLARTHERESSTFDPHERYFPERLYHSATAVLRPGLGFEDPPAILELHDPVRQPAMLWKARPGDSPVPLAVDMTTPLARQFADSRLNLIGVLGVLFPSEFDGKTGLYMMDPYQPGKIPVVFVHGLMSSPEAWTNAMNELRGDPALRERYQFWMFFYSTGNPILGSAARLRSALADARRDFDPHHQDPAFDRMILVGHSMGGLLSRLSISDSGATLWNAACRIPPDQLAIAPELKEPLMRALIFEPVPLVSRVVFVATPHQGSPMGDQLLGRVASSLIFLPRTATDIRDAMLNSNAMGEISPIFRDRRQLTSIAQLGTKNPVLKVVNRLPMREEVPHHSIVGYDGRGPLLEGGDGVVPYRSAHLEGALSELVVLSDHSVQENTDSIAEMRRILVEHVVPGGSLGVDDASRAPRLPIARSDGPTPIRYALDPSPRSGRPMVRVTSNPRLLLVR